MKSVVNSFFGSVGWEKLMEAQLFKNDVNLNNLRVCVCVSK